MGIASLILSILGAIIALVGLIPLLGILNWFAGGLLVIAIVLGILGIVMSKKKGIAIAGTIISAVFLIVAILRLVIGGGIL